MNFLKKYTWIKSKKDLYRALTFLFIYLCSYYLLYPLIYNFLLNKDSSATITSLDRGVWVFVGIIYLLFIEWGLSGSYKRYALYSAGYIILTALTAFLAVFFNIV